MLDGLRKLFGKGKVRLSESPTREELTAFVNRLSDNDRHGFLMIAGWLWVVGNEEALFAVTRAAQTVQDMQGRDTNLMASHLGFVQRQVMPWFKEAPTASFKLCMECFSHFAMGRDHVRMRDTPSPSRPPRSDPREAYAAYLAKYQLTREDMHALSTIAGFAWKHGGMSPGRAALYAMETIYLSRNGAPSEKAAADTTWESAIRWSIDAGLDSVAWGNEAVTTLRDGGD